MGNLRPKKGVFENIQVYIINSIKIKSSMKQKTRKRQNTPNMFFY